ncbi:MAG: hypothetical protein SXG53_16755 [Pseudomonadota bacterium]|nr:hypothetical protein [Pseudomonadota bacterium]
MTADISGDAGIKVDAGIVSSEGWLKRGLVVTVRITELQAPEACEAALLQRKGTAS